MVTYISAGVIYPVVGTPIKNGVIGVNNDGSIAAVLTPDEAKNIENIKHYEGILIPGLINTHCHLELSHLLGKIPEKTGLTGFIKEILAIRDHQTEEEIISAMQKADQAMYENGIVAVGDISNLLVSKQVKLKSKIYYHTFVEVFGFNRPSDPIIADGIKLKKDFEPLKASVVPHAPYSVSGSLFMAIDQATSADDVLSIHNQETLAENELFQSGTGKFADFFAALGIEKSKAVNTNQKSINYYLPKMPKQVNTLLVHNTFSDKADFDFAKQTHQKLYWCLCPNANLYIENNLPDVANFKAADVKITLGTDSLASNHQLNIISEMEILQAQKDIAFEESLKWATLNGAEFLGINAQYGSFEVGKKPGIVLVNLTKGEIISKQTTIKRLF